MPATARYDITVSFFSFRSKPKFLLIKKFKGYCHHTTNTITMPLTLHHCHAIVRLSLAESFYYLF